MSDTGPNQQQIEYWNEVAGPRWAEVTDRIHEQIAPLGDTAMERAKIQAGERILDVGCGCGQTTFELARRTGAEGQVLGIDISAPMLAVARSRAAESGATHVSFLEADAQVHRFEPASFDLVYSRFGVMFFDDPVAAFANLRGSLTEAGRLCFVCWQTIQHNPWMLTPAAAAAQHVEIQPPEPGAPGPFAFADDARVRGILADAGFVDVACEDLSGELSVGRGMALDEIVEFLSQMGPAGAALREASEETRARARSSMYTALEPFYSGDALVMGYAAWIVTARQG